MKAKNIFKKSNGVLYKIKPRRNSTHSKEYDEKNLMKEFLGKYDETMKNLVER